MPMLLRVDIDPSQHFEHPVVGVGGIAMDKGRLLLIQRSRAPYAGMWSIPGGKLNRGETLEQALAREMREETGLDIEVTRYAGLLESIFPDGRDDHYVILDYFVEVLGGELKAADDAADARWFELDMVRTLTTTPMLVESLERFGVL